MKRIRLIRQMQRWSEKARRRGLTVGFVPTMGCLHEGHASLIRRSLRENDRTVVSIFVNKLQFGPREDFAAYPRPLREDARLLGSLGADVLFLPSGREMYPPGFRTTVRVRELDGTLCGPLRPGHFEGVATVVLKLLHAAAPHRAYFGEKDYQQLKIIQRLVADVSVPVEIKACPTLREPGGLALSSRNRYLTTDQKDNANRIFAALQWGRKLLRFHRYSPARMLKSVRKRLQEIPQSHVEYIELVDAETLQPQRRRPRRPARLACAIRLGSARLIDNIPL